MSSPSPTGSPDIGTPSPGISNSALAEAAERRTRQTTPQLSAAQLAAEHERRQKFRRLVDPGIARPNPKDKAMSSLKTLLTISENLLREPNNEKFQQFKPTNTVIKRELVDRKGALEFAIELGFKPEVKNFQPYYIFHKRHIEDLKIGAAILKDYIATETIKEERIARAKKNEKETHEAAMEKVKLAYMDDRKAKLLRDEIEKEQRAGRAAVLAQQAAAESATASQRASASSDNDMPGSGRVLNHDQKCLELEDEQ